MQVVEMLLRNFTCGNLAANLDKCWLIKVQSGILQKKIFSQLPRVIKFFTSTLTSDRCTFQPRVSFCFKSGITRCAKGFVRR